MPEQQQPCVGCGLWVPAVNALECTRKGSRDPRLPDGAFGHGPRMTGGKRMGKQWDIGGLCDACTGKIREYIRTMVATTKG